MNEKYSLVYKILDKYSPEEIFFLHFKDEFQFLISVILSAQSTDSNVNKVGEILFKKYPNAAALKDADIEEVKTIIKTTGYYNNKAKNIIACANSIDEIGFIPEEYEELLKLSGVGSKTANCLLGFRGQPSIAVDTHVKNVVNRIFSIDPSLSPVKVERLLKENLSPKYWSRFSNSTNWWGRTYCTKRNPKCSLCRLRKFCDFYK
ncbi:MAG: endonuclease III [Sphaerochaetaceae bacterium]